MHNTSYLDVVLLLLKFSQSREILNFYAKYGTECYAKFKFFTRLFLLSTGNCLVLDILFQENVFQMTAVNVVLSLKTLQLQTKK